MMSNAAIQKSSPLLVSGRSRASGGLLVSLLRLPVMLLDLMIDWQQSSEERATMTNLSGRQLRDIGLSAEAMQRMAAKVRWNRRI